MGLPVQWCGLVYADTLLDLAEFDKTTDWKKNAKGMKYQIVADGKIINIKSKGEDEMELQIVN